MTKRWILPLGLGGLVTLAGVGWLLCERRGPSPLGGLVSEGHVISVGVEALVENPNRYRGELQVAGVVARIVAEERLFSLADLSDRDEVLKTGDTECVTLPVRWTGPMPALHEEVQVQGKVEESKGQLVFVGSAVRKAPHGSVPGGPK